MKKNLIQEKSFQFAVEVVDLCKTLKAQQEHVIANQLLKCGTSIGSNIEEATAAESKADFIHKMAIASKEARETHYWLRILQESSIDIPSEICTPYIDELSQIINILTKIVKTSRSNNQ